MTTVTQTRSRMNQKVLGGVAGGLAGHLIYRLVARPVFAWFVRR